MTQRKRLSEILAAEDGPPKIIGIVDAVLRGEDGEIIQHVHQHNLITDYLRLLFVNGNDFVMSGHYLFINENSEPAHPKRTSMRTTLPGTFDAAITPTLDGPNRIWTFQNTFAAPPSQRTVRTIGLAKVSSVTAYTNLKSGVYNISAMTVLSTPIVQGTSAQLEVSYRLAFQRS